MEGVLRPPAARYDVHCGTQLSTRQGSADQARICGEAAGIEATKVETVLLVTEDVPRNALVA
jgi:hypothetical protein